MKNKCLYCIFHFDNSLAKTENPVLPLGMLLPKSRVQWLLKFCHRSKQGFSDPPRN